MKNKLTFRATILQNGTMDAAYVEVPYDIKELFDITMSSASSSFRT